VFSLVIFLPGLVGDSMTIGNREVPVFQETDFASSILFLACPAAQAALVRSRFTRRQFRFVLRTYLRLDLGAGR
jgi:hypothetical protein